MKKQLFTLLLLSLISMAAYAQMQQDSTFYVIAYWELGEKCTYEYNQSEYTVQNGDTTDVSYSMTKVNSYEFKIIENN